MIYREVAKVKFNNKLFQMYIGERNERFFLDITNNVYNYPTLEDLIELEYIFAKREEHISDIKMDGAKMKDFIPKVIYKGMPVLLSAGLILGATGCTKSTNFNNTSSSTTATVSQIQTDLGFEVVDQTEDLEIDTYKESEQFNYKFIYDAEHLDKIFGNQTITEDDLIKVIDENTNITDRFNPFLKEYVHLFINAYPDADLRILYNNFKDLKVVECEDKLELMSYTLSYDSYACYMRSENVIYTAKEYEYEKGTWEYQVIMHELSHAARTYWKDTDGDGRFNVKAQFEGLNLNPVSVSEAMNSIFTVRMFDYEERDIAYQLQSNYFSVILDSIDNYQLSDYMNHSLSYFADKLDEAGGYNNYASVIFELIETQYDDFHSERIQIDEEEYYPIYDFIADLYFKKNLKYGMSKEEMTAVCDTLVERITFDVKEEYHIDSNHFYVYLEEYIKEHKLDVNSEEYIQQNGMDYYSR